MARYIDADTIPWECFPNDFGEYHEDYVEKCVVDKMPTVEARPAWISVKHLLPRAGQEVIAYSGNKMKPSVFATTFYAKTWTAWQTITHWMPLPEPPNCCADMRGEDDG